MNLNVFVASTPLQLISCAEARARYECEASSCLLIIARPDNKVTENQMAFRYPDNLLEEKYFLPAPEICVPETVRPPDRSIVHRE